MKFTCDRNALNEAINIVSKAASQKSTIPALEGIQISTLQDGVVQLSAYDLSVSITYDLEAEDTKKGIAVLSSKLFGEIIRKLPSCPVTVEIDNKTYLTTIDGGNAHFTITGMSDENFPELPDVLSQDGIVLKEIAPGVDLEKDILANMDFILICTYEAEGDNPELILYKKR